ncbi:MAG: hypothetical protein ACT4OM_08435 [Actinomycetota bacterium]
MTTSRALALTQALLLFCAACTPPTDEPAGDSTSPEKEIDYHSIAQPKPVGTGFLVETSLDGSALFVTDTDPTFPQPGCEGQPESVLQLLNLASGTRELLRNGDKPLKDQLFRGPAGQTAMVDICEEFFVALQVGRESAGGQINNVTVVDPALDAGSELFAPFSFSWSNDGRILAAIADIRAPDGNPPRLVAINPESSEITDLFEGNHGTGVFQFAQLAAGTYVESSNRVVNFRNSAGDLLAAFPGNGFTVTPDRTGVVTYGEVLATVSEGQSEATTLVPRKPGWEISSANVSPDGRAVAFNRYHLEGGMNEIGIVTIDDYRFTMITSGDGLGEPRFTGDGKALAFNLFDPADGSAGVLLARLGG